MKKVLNVIKKLVDILVFVFVIAFVAVVCLQRFSNNEFSVFGYRIFTVVTGSMSPKYVVGDVLVAKEVKPSEVKVGDALSYLGNSGSFKDKVVTHEVKKIEQDIEGKYVFTTQGLTNIVEDPLVYESQIYGVVKYKTVILSFVYKCVGTKTGMFLFIGLPILYIIGSEMIYAMLEKEEKRRAKLKKQKDDAKKISEEKLEEVEKKESKPKKTKKVEKK